MDHLYLIVQEYFILFNAKNNVGQLFPMVLCPKYLLVNICKRKLCFVRNREVSMVLSHVGQTKPA